MGIIPDVRFYVYALERPDGSVFYIGKGQKSRIRAHEWEARRGHNCHKCNIIRKVWESGGQIRKRILIKTNDESDALLCEQMLIASYGLENLANLTIGGDGVTGYTFTNEDRAKISRAAKRRFSDPIQRARQSEIMHARYENQDLLEGHRIRRRSAQARQRASISARQQWQDIEMRNRMQSGIRAAKNTSEARAAQSERSAQMWLDPSAKQERIKNIRAARGTEQQRRMTSQSAKDRWANPKQREAQSERMREIWRQRKKQKEK